MPLDWARGLPVACLSRLLLLGVLGDPKTALASSTLLPAAPDVPGPGNGTAAVSWPVACR